MKKFLNENKNNVWFWLFICIAAILLIVMPLMSRNAGNSGDEDKFQIPQGRFVMDYYASDGQDTTCLKDVVNLNGKEQSWNLKYYGCSFDVVTEWINRTFGIEDIAATRHACNALLGWIIVFFGGLIAWRVAGWRAGVFAMLLLFFSPRLLGHSFNNPKDIPLAAGVIMTIYYMMMFFRQVTPLSLIENGKNKKTAVAYPESLFSEKATNIIAYVLMAISFIALIPTAGIALAIIIEILIFIVLKLKDTPRFNPLTLMMLALSLSLAVSNRIGGLIVVGYMGLWGLLWLIRNGRHVGAKTITKVFITALCTCAIGFFGGLLLWPFAMQSPIHNSIESFKLMSQFDVQLRQLFEGVMVMSSELPWYYTPKFMLMTIPIAVILGWIIYPFVGAFCKERRIESIMLYFCFLFPVFWIVYTGANVYGGWRHSLFAYPPMAITAALGYNALAEWSARKSNKKVVELVLSLVPLFLIIPPAIHTVKNHPHEYVYFNELEGGVKNAFGKYELDYYYHSMREATEWVINNASPKEDGSKTIIGSWHLESTSYFLRNDTARFGTRFVRWNQRYNYDWDYLVFPITGISGQYLKGPAFPPADCVYTVNVDDTPIAVVLKRQTKDDFAAAELMKNGQIDTAVTLFENVLKQNPFNETALSSLAEIALQKNENDKVIQYAGRMLEADSSNTQAIQMIAYAYLNSGKMQEAMTLLNNTKARSNDPFTYSMLAQLYAQQGNISAAQNEIESMLRQGVMDQNALNLYVQIRMAQGSDQNTAVYSFYSTYANGLEKKGNKKAADEIRKQINAR